MKRLIRKAKGFSLQGYWKQRMDELKQLVFSSVKENIGYHHCTSNDKKYQEIVDKMENEPYGPYRKFDLACDMSEYLINHNGDLYNSIIENADRGSDADEPDYESEYAEVTSLLRQLFNNNDNALELAQVLGLTIPNN